MTHIFRDAITVVLSPVGGVGMDSGAVTRDSRLLG